MNPEITEEALRLDRQLCFPLYAAARKIVSAYTPALKPLGITYTQYLVFLVLWEQDGLPMGELCRRLRLDSGTLTPVLKKLEAMGYLSRHRSEEDERVVTLRLTEAGRELKQQALAVPPQVAGTVRLAPEEAGQLYTLLYRFLDEEKETFAAPSCAVVG